MIFILTQSKSQVPIMTSMASPHLMVRTTQPYRLTLLVSSHLPPHLVPLCSSHSCLLFLSPMSMLLFHFRHSLLLLPLPGASRLQITTILTSPIPSGLFSNVICSVRLPWLILNSPLGATGWLHGLGFWLLIWVQGPADEALVGLCTQCGVCWRLSHFAPPTALSL